MMVLDASVFGDGNGTSLVIDVGNDADMGDYAVALFVVVVVVGGCDGFAIIGGIGCDIGVASYGEDGTSVVFVNFSLIGLPLLFFLLPHPFHSPFSIRFRLLALFSIPSPFPLPFNSNIHKIIYLHLIPL